ncbi:Bacterial extracellular solute-binding protein [uncultured archaeon]|nr:Bacterial extracellular solute-binding protein [uncultured archaeon]
MKQNKPEYLVAAMAFTVFVALCLNGGETNNTPPNLTAKPTLTVYTYDSFNAEWGPGPKVFPIFESQCNCKVNVITAGDTGQVLNRLILEKDNPKADVVVGIDNSFLSKALSAGILVPYSSRNIEKVPQRLRFDSTGSLTPYDYGYVTFVYDSSKISPPNSLLDLLDPKYSKKFILEDPRTSSPGLIFFMQTVQALGEDKAWVYWRNLSKQALAIAPSWDEAQTLFSSGEAPMYLSYATSPSYYVEYENKTNFLAVDFSEGLLEQVEGSGIVKGTRNVELAQSFIDFTLTPEFQNELPQTQWMFPVLPDAKIPESFSYAVKPNKTLTLNTNLTSEDTQRWLAQWEDAVKA